MKNGWNFYYALFNTVFSRDPPFTFKDVVTIMGFYSLKRDTKANQKQVHEMKGA